MLGGAWVVLYWDHVDPGLKRWDIERNLVPCRQSLMADRGSLAIYCFCSRARGVSNVRACRDMIWDRIVVYWYKYILCKEKKMSKDQKIFICTIGSF